jgi:hypothetical protein
MTTHSLPVPAATTRVAAAFVATGLVGALTYESIKHGTDYRQIVVFVLAPDLALFLGLGRGLAKGQLHPRAVGAYNLLHRIWGPLALAAFAALGTLPHAFLIGAMAWGFHVALDRTVGYGLRDRDGFQRR